MEVDPLEINQNSLMEQSQWKGHLLQSNPITLTYMIHAGCPTSAIHLKECLRTQTQSSPKSVHTGEGGFLKRNHDALFWS